MAGAGTGGFRDALGNSAMDGRGRRLRLSGSSLLIFGSPLDELLDARPDPGVEAVVGVELPLLFLSDNNVDTDRVSLLGEGSILRLRGDASFEPRALFLEFTESRAFARC